MKALHIVGGLDPANGGPSYSVPRLCDVLRGRGVEADIVTARAVASIDKLVKWCMPLLSPTGQMVLLKGRSAQDELDRAKYALRKHRLAGEVCEAGTLPGLEPTRVVRLTRQANR